MSRWEDRTGILPGETWDPELCCPGSNPSCEPWASYSNFEGNGFFNQKLGVLVVSSWCCCEMMD